MAESLYTSQTPGPGLGDLSDLGAAGGTTATTIMFTVAGTVTGIRFYATTTKGGTYTGELWDCDSSDGVSGGAGTGTLLGAKSAAASAITAGTWNVITFDTPVSVTTGVAYRAALHNSQGRYVALQNFFTTSLVNGNLTGIQSATNPAGVGNLRNGVFHLDAGAGNYPSDFSGTTTYLVDLVFEEAGGNVDATFAATGPGGTAALTGALDTTGGLVGTGSSGTSALTASYVAPESGGTTTRTGWNGLAAIYRHDREIRAQDALGPPTNCPNDGTQLAITRDGEYWCPFDGWTWQGEDVTW